MNLSVIKDKCSLTGINELTNAISTRLRRNEEKLKKKLCVRISQYGVRFGIQRSTFAETGKPPAGADLPLSLGRAINGIQRPALHHEPLVLRGQ